jgi:hypothetical protein
MTQLPKARRPFDFTTASLPNRLREHARVLYEELPTGEQFIDVRDVLLTKVIREIADWIEAQDSLR